MSDLAKLTAEELLLCEHVIQRPQWLAEIRRRLERLEKCEAALRGYMAEHKRAEQDHSNLGRHECDCLLCVQARAALETK